MRRMLTLSAAAMLLAGTAFAGSQEIIKQRAKELRDQNNVRQGVAPPTQPPAPAAPAPGATQARPTQSPALTKLQADLGAIQANAQVSAEQKQQLAKDLMAASQGAGKPSAAAAARLADDLSTAFAQKPLSAANRARLVQELDAVLNPAKYPQAKMEGIYADMQAIFQVNGIARNDAVKIVDDVKAIASEVNGASR